MDKDLIIKALECCYTDKRTCSDCPFQDPAKYMECSGLALSALELIKELTEENEKIGIENFDLVCELSRIKEDTVRKMQDMVTMHFGTYTDKDTVKIIDVFRLIDQIAKDMAEGI